MLRDDTGSEFSATLLRPAAPCDGAVWAFIVLPKDASAKLPRRGRTSVNVSINGYEFQAMLEPDGQRSHWLQIDNEQLVAAGVVIGSTARFQITALAQEPQPALPEDFAEALASCPEAKAVWDDTSNIAKLDWIHWLVSAKQSKTREKRINDACEQLCGGKRRVCCFDPSGFYSKAFAAPKAAE